MSTSPATRNVTIRRNWGSFPEVLRVFAIQPHTRLACVQFKDRGGQTYIDCVPWSELEALDQERTFADIEKELTKRTENTVR